MGTPMRPTGRQVCPCDAGRSSSQVGSDGKLYFSFLSLCFAPALSVIVVETAVTPSDLKKAQVRFRITNIKTVTQQTATFLFKVKHLSEK